MIKIGQIESSNQYSLKRNNSSLYGNKNVSLLSSKHYHIKTQKPLQSDALVPISFKGFAFAKKTVVPVAKFVPKNIAGRVFKTLKQISQEQLETYKDINRRYIKFIAENKAYRDAYGITDEMVEKLVNSEGTMLIFQPQKSIAAKFFSQLFSPFKTVYNWGQSLFLPKDSKILLKKKEDAQILKNYRALDGLVRSHIIWENGYRKLAGHPKLQDNSKFLIPDDVIHSKLGRRRHKVVDPNKGKYSSNSLMIGNRLISGIVYSYFLGTDAYNTTMRYSNNKQEATAQRKSRVSQEFSRIGLNMYIQNLLFGTFENAVNRSLSTAMLVSGSTVAFSEILGRKLVGKPIMPSNKEKLDNLEKEMAEKKGVLPAIGRLLTNVKKKDNKINSKKDAKKIFDLADKKANVSIFSDFAAKNTNTIKSNNPAFKGLPQIKDIFKREILLDKQLVKRIYSTVKNADAKTAENIKYAVNKAARKSKYLNNITSEGLTFNEIINNDEIKSIPFGYNVSKMGKLVESIFVPIKFVCNMVKNIKAFTKKTFLTLFNKKDTALYEELQRLKTTDTPKAKRIYKKFKDFYDNRTKLEVWAKSPYSEDEKLLKIFSEFKSIKSKDKEEIAGVKNIILWLDKQLTKEGIQIKEDGTLSEKHAQRVKEILMESVKNADGAKQLEYDGNTLAQANINLSRAITTLFLVTDAYNLTMQYSNDNKKDANKSAKNRAVQEISRIGVSAYMMAFVHNLLAKLCNSSLGGAFTLTALTSTINDSVSREVVGVPLVAKSQSELIDIDKKNGESKNPIKKALAYSIGKKSVLAGLKGSDNSTPKNIDYFAKDFFVTPQIH